MQLLWPKTASSRINPAQAVTKDVCFFFFIIDRIYNMKLRPTSWCKTFLVFIKILVMTYTLSSGYIPVVKKKKSKQDCFGLIHISILEELFFQTLQEIVHEFKTDRFVLKWHLHLSLEQISIKTKKKERIIIIIWRLLLPFDSFSLPERI